MWVDGNWGIVQQVIPFFLNGTNEIEFPQRPPNMPRELRRLLLQAPSDELGILHDRVTLAEKERVVVDDFVGINLVSIVLAVVKFMFSSIPLEELYPNRVRQKTGDFRFS